MKKCQICGKRASMFLTQIINGQATELALCEECAKAKGLFDPQSLSFAEKFFPDEFRKRVDKLINELTRAVESEPDGVPEPLVTADSLTQCPGCRFTLEDFRKTGRFGCPDCYRVFADEPDGNASKNAADIPTTDEMEPMDAATLRRHLEQQLAQAVQREDYEEAARLRDRIRELD